MHACNRSDPPADIGRGFWRMRIADLRADPIHHGGYPPLFISARPAVDLGGYPPFVADPHLIRHFYPWLSCFKYYFCRNNLSIWRLQDSTKDPEWTMLAQEVIIPKALKMKSKKLMSHLVEPMLSVLRQTASYFLKYLIKVLNIILWIAVFVKLECWSILTTIISLPQVILNQLVLSVKNCTLAWTGNEVDIFRVENSLVTTAFVKCGSSCSISSR